jgi:signal transduction histidine kinase
MKLLTYTSRVQLLIFMLLFAIFSTVFYLVMSWNVRQNVNEVLYNRKSNLLAYLKENSDAPFAIDNPLDDFTFTEISEDLFRPGQEIYSDTLIYEATDNELDEYRKLTSYEKLHGKYYHLEIVKPHLEADEIISTIAITLGGLFLGLTICYYISLQFISRKIWRPFYIIIENLRKYRFDNDKPLELPETDIDEFALLNGAVSDLTRKNKDVFESQKQFIENASHEMQTPLSAIQSQLEILIEQPELTGKQASILEGMISATQRLKKLNKTLLLLSKIENRQFLLTEEVSLSSIIYKILEYFEEQKDRLQLTLTIEVSQDIVVSGNVLLTETLVQNLLKNAFVHNRRGGYVIIKLSSASLIITNSGTAKEADATKIFERFYKSSDNPESWGLGLAIAKKIAELSGWVLEYSNQQDSHTFSLRF